MIVRDASNRLTGRMRYATSPSPASSYDADASAYFAAVTTPFSAARKAIINTLVTTLKADGNWTKLDRLWLMANEASDQGLISLVNPTSTAMTLVNAPIFTVDQGFAGDAITKSINTNFIPSVNGVNYTTTNASMGLYCRTNDVTTNQVDMGSSDGTLSDFIISFTGTLYMRMNNGFASTAVASTLGLFSARVTPTDSYANRNGSQIVTDATNPSYLPVTAHFGLARNDLGVAVAFSNKQHSIYYMGSSDINDATFYTAIQNYMTSLGTQV